jgi:hypothetical protein
VGRKHRTMASIEQLRAPRSAAEKMVQRSRPKLTPK